MEDAARIWQPYLNVISTASYAKNAALNYRLLVHDLNMITKPFDIDALANRIRGLIEGEDRRRRG